MSTVTAALSVVSILAAIVAVWSAYTARRNLELHWRPYVTVGFAEREDGTWLEMRNSGRSSAYGITVSLTSEMPWANANENPFRYRDVLHPGESYMERLQGDETRHDRLYGAYTGRIGWGVVVRYRGERYILAKELLWRAKPIMTSLELDLTPGIGAERKGKEYWHSYEIRF